MSEAEPNVPAESGGSVPTTPNPQGINVQPSGSGGSWRDGLSPDLKENQYLTGIDSVEKLANEHVNAQKLIGKKGVVVPDENATPDDWERFHQRWGRPESPDKYDLSGFEVREDVPWGEGLQDMLLKSFHEAGLNNRQANAALKGLAEKQTQMWDEHRATATEAGETAESELRKEWGRAFDAKRDLANRAFLELFGDKANEVMGMQTPDGVPLGDHPLIAQAFAKIGEQASEAGMMGDKADGGRQTFTPVEATAEIARLNGDKDFQAILMDKGHPEHEIANQKRSALYAAAYGGT